MGGIVIAFKDFNIFAGRTPLESIIKSEWVGLSNFTKLFNNMNFLRAFRNTLIISTYKIVFLFPVPIILAIMITDIKAKWYRKSIQTILYLPHFLSWVVVTAL
ncbi:MAG: sugar ABC transporter permease, partial [Bacilli bacterium]